MIAEPMNGQVFCFFDAIHGFAELLLERTDSVGCR